MTVHFPNTCSFIANWNEIFYTVETCLICVLLAYSLNTLVKFYTPVRCQTSSTAHCNEDRFDVDLNGSIVYLFHVVGICGICRYDICQTLFVFHSEYNSDHLRGVLRVNRWLCQYWQMGHKSVYYSLLPHLDSFGFTIRVPREESPTNIF